MEKNFDLKQNQIFPPLQNEYKNYKEIEIEQIGHWPKANAKSGNSIYKSIIVKPPAKPPPTFTEEFVEATLTSLVAQQMVYQQIIQRESISLVHSKERALSPINVEAYFGHEYFEIRNLVLRVPESGHQLVKTINELVTTYLDSKHTAASASGDTQEYDVLTRHFNFLSNSSLTNS